MKNMKNLFKNVGQKIENNFLQHQGKYFLFGTIVIPFGTYIIGRYYSEEETNNLGIQEKLELIEQITLKNSTTQEETKKLILEKIESEDIQYKILKTDDSEYIELLECIKSNPQNSPNCLEDNELFVKVTGNNENEGE